MSSKREQWRPDELLVPAITAGGRKRMDDLCEADRAWAVAGLVAQGLTAEDIADRLDCSVRLVWTVRSWQITDMAELYQQEMAAFAGELAMVRAELRQAVLNIAAARALADKATAQRDRMLGAYLDDGAAATAFGCGHDKTRYNTYRHAATGKTSCRTCHRERQRARRAAYSSPPSTMRPSASV